MLLLFILLPLLLILTLHSLSYFARYLELTKKPDYARRPWALRGRDLIPFFEEYGFILATFSLLLIDLALGPLLRPFRRRVKGRWDGSPPLILIHGLGMSPLTMLPLYLRLRAMGRKNLHFFRYGRNEAEFTCYSNSLRAEIKKILEVSTSPPLQLLCHSLGGLIAREYLVREGGEGVSSI
ncbi:MAG: esterase/lipase family protein, partial [Nitrospinota bacterium]